MARTKNYETSRLLKMNYLILLLWIPGVLEACTHPVQPRYQPISESSGWSPPFQGYASHQIDDRTYLIAYQNYFSSLRVEGKWADPLDGKWVKGAQEYVLYRAGELVKSKGAKYFAVLHKDDWIQVHGIGRYPLYMPSALVMVRVLDKNAFSIPSDDHRVHEADKVLDSLAKKNIGLAEHHGTSAAYEGTVKLADDQVIRWRSSIISDPVPFPSFMQYGALAVGGFGYSPETEITKVSSDAFDIAMFGPYMVAPVELLSKCVQLADREGYETFKLENWTVEEHRNGGGPHNRRIWFRTKARVALQHYQKKSESLEPVFLVEEIRSNVDTKNIQLKD